jgi:hypothetical protein
MRQRRNAWRRSGHAIRICDWRVATDDRRKSERSGDFNAIQAKQRLEIAWLRKIWLTFAMRIHTRDFGTATSQVAHHHFSLDFIFH